VPCATGLRSSRMNTVMRRPWRDRRPSRRCATADAARGRRACITGTLLDRAASSAGLGQDFTSQAGLRDGASTSESGKSGNGGGTRQVSTQLAPDSVPCTSGGPVPGTAASRCSNARAQKLIGAGERTVGLSRRGPSRS
jgi:hypothetical protein